MVFAAASEWQRTFTTNARGKNKRRVTSGIFGEICPHLAAPLRRGIPAIVGTRGIPDFVVRTWTNLSALGSARGNSRRLFRRWRERRTICVARRHRFAAFHSQDAAEIG